MKLRELLRDVEVRERRVDLDLEITSVTADSRLVVSGALFAAIPGFKTDGAKFIDAATRKGAEYGGTVAAPAFKEIAEATLRYLNVAPSVPARTIDLGAPMLATFSQKRAPTAGSEVPDLRGLDARAAVALATRSGFRVRASGSGVVQTQQPLPGEALPNDHQVVLTLAEGAR